MKLKLRKNEINKNLIKAAHALTSPKLRESSLEYTPNLVFPPDTPADFKNPIDRIDIIYDVATRESLALLQAEKQERDIIEQQALTPEEKGKSLAKIDQEFLQKRKELTEKMYKEIEGIRKPFNDKRNAIKKDYDDHKFKSYEMPEIEDKYIAKIDSEIEALVDIVNFIVYPSVAQMSDDSEKKPLLVKIDGEGENAVTHFKRPSKFFGSVEVCKMEHKNGDAYLTFTSASASEVDFIVEKLVQTYPDKKVVLTCSRNYSNLEAVAERLMAKGFKPEDIHLEFKDDKTGKIERTDYAKHKGLEGKALVAANKKAQQNATELADTKIAELGVLLKEANKADPVLGESSTPQQRLTALTQEPMALQRDAKIKSLVAQPELAVAIIAQAHSKRPTDPLEVAMSDKLIQQILEQTPTGLLKTFTRLQEATNYLYDLTQAQSTDLAQAKSYLSVVAKGTTLSLNDRRNFVTLFQRNPILSSNTTIMKSAENYEQARAAFNQANNLLMQTPSTANSATFWAHINQDPTAAQATNRIETGKAKAGDHDIVISALNKAAEENHQWKREIDQLVPTFSTHKKSLENFNARKQEFQGLAGRCLDDLSHPELLLQMQESRISFTRRLAQNNPEKIAQMLFIAHEKGDEETRNSFAPLLAAIPVEEQESITKELLKIKGGADVLDQYSNSLKLHQPQISPLDTGVAPAPS